MGCCGSDPKVPDPSASYIEGVHADIDTLPQRRAIENAARTGQKITVGGRVYDFTGRGEADVAGTEAAQTAQELLRLQREYGPQYVAQRLAELKRADPEGFAARTALWDTISGDLASAGETPEYNRSLRDRIMADLSGDTELTPDVRSEIEQQVLGHQVARGNFRGDAATTQRAKTLVDATEANRRQRQTEALQFLTSGASPEDVEFRQRQQALSNAGAFRAGATPTAQFGQLSGAQVGAAPAAGGGPGPGLNPNAGAQGQAFANNAFGSNLALWNGQVNPWTAGLTGAASGLGIWASLGAGQVTGPGGAPATRFQGNAGTAYRV